MEAQAQQQVLLTPEEQLQLLADVKQLAAQITDLREDFEERREVIHTVRNQMTTINGKLKANSELCAKIGGDTAELLEILKACKAGLRFIGAIGSGLKWIAGVAAAVAALWKAMGWRWPWQ